jgi:hypothetical protein
MSQNAEAEASPGPRETVSRLYRDYPAAQEAVRLLQAAGIDADDISVIANNSEKWFSPDFVTSAAKGAAVGVGLGGFGGVLAGLGLLAIPGLGPVVAAGWLAAAAAGAASVGAAGGIIGLLAEAGVATNEAEVYAESLRRGGSFVSARVPSTEKARFEAIMDPTSVKVDLRRNDLAASGWERFDASGEPMSAADVAQDRATHRG